MKIGPARQRPEEMTAEPRTEVPATPEARARALVRFAARISPTAELRRSALTEDQAVAKLVREHRAGETETRNRPARRRPEPAAPAGGGRAPAASSGRRPTVVHLPAPATDASWSL